MLITSNAAEKYVSDLLQNRAFTKLRMAGSIASLVSDAAHQLRESGNWHDDVMIDVFLSAGSKDSNRCNRLLHGVPAPRFWHAAGGNHCKMPAIDVIYFFTGSEAQRHEVYDRAMPEFQDLAALEEWLKTFTSRRMDRGLIDAFLNEAERTLSKASSVEYEGLLRSKALQRTAMAAAEVDRYAWYRGYRTMNLAKAAPVFKLKQGSTVSGNKSKRARPNPA